MPLRVFISVRIPRTDAFYVSEVGSICFYISYT